MIAVGTLGTTLIGTVQDKDFNVAVKEQAADVHSIVAQTKPGLFSEYESVDKTKYAQLSETQRTQLEDIERPVKQHALVKIAVLPAIMFVCYLILILYFQSRGGYKAEELTGSPQKA